MQLDLPVLRAPLILAPAEKLRVFWALLSSGYYNEGFNILAVINPPFFNMDGIELLFGA